MKVYPTEFECLDHDTPIFKIKAVNGEYAEVKIDTPVDARTWREIAPLIETCLVQMNLED